MPDLIVGIAFGVIGVGYGSLLVRFPERFASFSDRMPGRTVGPAEVKRIGIGFIAIGAIGCAVVVLAVLLRPH